MLLHICASMAFWLGIPRVKMVRLHLHGGLFIGQQQLPIHTYQRRLF
jgi:hypothetical protein